MVTATRTETKHTTTVKRSWLLQWQVRNLLSRTTDISQDTLTKIDTALTHQWIQMIGVYGLDSKGRCHVGLELSIDWVTHTFHLLVTGDEVTIDRTVFSPDDLAPEVHNGITVFNQAVNAECLHPLCRFTYATGAPVEHVRRVLGFVPAAPLSWAGRVEKKNYPVPELPELTVSFKQAIPEEVGLSRDKALFDRIKEAFG
jgi:hypothetical protein